MIILTIHSYKPDVNLRFISEELGFESDADAAQFICESNGSELLEERPDGIQFFTAKAGPLFERAKSEAFRRVDIKGQI
jgi:SAC3 family protein LENG8/THP3